MSSAGNASARCMPPEDRELCGPLPDSAYLNHLADDGFSFRITFGAIQIKGTRKYLLRDSTDILAFAECQAACTEGGIRCLCKFVRYGIAVIRFPIERQGIPHGTDEPVFYTVCRFEGDLLFYDRVNKCLKYRWRCRGL